MGVLTILGLILLVVFAIVFPLIGIPTLIITIIGVIIFRVLKGGAGLTYKGIKSITTRPPPQDAGEKTDRYCTNCGTNLLRIPNESGLWCPSCKAWYE